MFNIKILKYPISENDDMLLHFDDFYLSEDRFNDLLKQDKYLKTKFDKFKTMDVSGVGLEDFSYKPSLSKINSLSKIQRTIYTYAVKEENVPWDYEAVINQVKSALETSSRRIVIRFLNSLPTYLNSEDVSCLAFIHYIYVNNLLNVRIVYRASDIKNELFYDILLIYYYFIKPITSKPISLSFYTSSSQNVEFLDQECDKIRRCIIWK